MPEITHVNLHTNLHNLYQFIAMDYYSLHPAGANPQTFGVKLLCFS
jgi:hypothetical protein